MNWACAAGTGALIEKHAKNLNIPITEFGSYAIKAINHRLSTQPVRYFPKLRCFISSRTTSVLKTSVQAPVLHQQKIT
jgi:hypothetical protein